MLHLIKTTTDKFFNHLHDDPVRPSIPFESRIGYNRDVFVLHNNDRVQAITCVSYQNNVPSEEVHLFDQTDNPDLVVFYTIWSYESGAGRELIFKARDWIIQNKPEVKRFVTLSPTSEMAQRFHIKNGAITFRSNQTTVNYEYL